MGEIFTQALTVTSLQLVRLNQASLNVLVFFCHAKHFAGICFELILSFFFLFSLPGYESREDPPTQLGEMLPRPEEEAQTSHQVLLIISVLFVTIYVPAFLCFVTSPSTVPETPCRNQVPSRGLEGWRCCVFADAFLWTFVVTSGYLCSCCPPVLSNHSVQSDL